MAEVGLPTITGYVDQKWFLEPLMGAETPKNVLDRFPPEVYNANPESHLAKLLYVLVGPAGIGFLRKNALDARLKLEELGLELFDLDAFYGEPLKFTRVVQELYDEDPNGLLTREQWETIRARDAQYRSRVLDFLDGVRAGNSPLGMEYVARSGLGHSVTIIENYKALFDEWSDDPIGITNYGKTRFLEEMIVLPRREITRSEVQVITIIGSPTGGTFTIDFNGQTTAAITHGQTAGNIQLFLEALGSILPGDVEVTGGPLPNVPIKIRFMGSWAARDVPQIRTNSSLTGGTSPTIQSTTEQSGVDAADEVAFIPDSDKYHLQVALDRIRPQTVIPTMSAAAGLRARTLFQTVKATSEYDEVIRFVTGNDGVAYPAPDSISWIESGIEHQSPRGVHDLQYQYSGWHNIKALNSFTEQAAEDPGYSADANTIMAADPSSHIGPFSEFQLVVFPTLGLSPTVQYSPDMALADYAEPLVTRTIVEGQATASATQLINGIYPTSYAGLPGVPEIKYNYEQFWASRERAEGDEYLELDLGSAQAVNTLQFEITKKPLDLVIEYDLADQTPERRYAPVRLVQGSQPTTNFAPEDQNPWQFMDFVFGACTGQLIFTRYIRIKFTRRNNVYSPFAILGLDGSVLDFHPWSVDVRNLRIGRNVTNVK